MATAIAAASEVRRQSRSRKALKKFTCCTCGKAPRANSLLSHAAFVQHAFGPRCGALALRVVNVHAAPRSAETRDDLIAAVWGPGDGLAGPAEVTAGFARRARELGVKIAEGVRVESIERTEGRVTGVTTTAGAISSPAPSYSTGRGGNVGTDGK